MVVGGFCEQPLRIRQSEDLFGKSVKLGFVQLFRLRCDALNRCTTGDKPVCSLAPIPLFVVGGAVLKALDFVLLLHKLPLDLFFGPVQIYAQNYLQAPADLKSAGNRGVVHDRLQVLHVHVFLAAPLGARHMA